MTSAPTLKENDQSEKATTNDFTVFSSSFGVLQVDYQLMEHNDVVVEHHEDENERNKSHNRTPHIRDISKQLNLDEKFNLNDR